MWNFDIVISELKRAKKNQRGLAEYIGVPEQRIADWKSGRIKKSWTSYIPKIAEYIGVPASTFDDEAEIRIDAKKEPSTISDAGFKELDAIFSQLSSDNRAKLLELSRLYLGSQHND